MNRIVLVGNGFDLAHGLKTRYEDFINWYCDQRVHGFAGNLSDISSDILCSFQDLRHQVWNVNAHSNGFNLNNAKGKDIVDHLIKSKDYFRTTMSPFFENIYKSIETKGWVDIENEYYDLLKKYAIEESTKDNLHELNLQLQYVQLRLAEYLVRCQQGANIISKIVEKIYAPIKMSDISIAGQSSIIEYIQKWWLIQNDDVLQEKAEEVGANQTITEPEAEALLKSDLKVFENAVNSAVKVGLTQSQFDACISLAYNIGTGAFANSDIVKNINGGKFGHACVDFPSWRKAGGQILAGLFSRRQIEMDFFGLGEEFTITNTMNIRSGPGTNNSIRKVSQITANGRECVVDKTTTANAMFKPGTVVTALELKAIHTTAKVEVWLRCPSGWICARDGDDVYVN